MDGTLTAMAFLGQNRLYDNISWNSHLSIVFLELRRLSMAFHGLSLDEMDVGKGRWKGRGQGFDQVKDEEG